MTYAINIRISFKNQKKPPINPQKILIKRREAGVSVCGWIRSWFALNGDQSIDDRT